MKKIMIIFLSVLLSGCCTMNWVLKNEDEVCDYCLNKYVNESDSLTINFKIDTVITNDTLKLINDSLLMDLLLECDSNYNVIIAQGEETKSKYQKLKYKLYKNRLSISSYIDSIKVLNRQINIEKNKIKTKVKEVEKVVYKSSAKNVLIAAAIGIGLGVVIALLLVVTIRNK